MQAFTGHWLDSAVPAALALAEALLGTTVSGCPGQRGEGKDHATAQISGYNHTEDYIHQFYVDGAWGGNVFAYSGEGSFVCCLVYPQSWRAGLAARVRWTTSSSDPHAVRVAAEEHWHEAEVPMEPYKTAGTTHNVHFLEGGKVRDRAPSYLGPRLPPKPAGFKL